MKESYTQEEVLDIIDIFKAQIKSLDPDYLWLDSGHYIEVWLAQKGFGIVRGYSDPTSMCYSKKEVRDMVSKERAKRDLWRKTNE
jgi:hypothetical protein